MANAFRLTVGEDRLATLAFDLPDRRVNVFTEAVLRELEALVRELARRTDFDCLVLVSGKPDNFIAGADVEAIAGVTDPELATEAARLGHRIFGAWEALPFPTVAAIRGSCVGGGTELALASTYRVASDRQDLRIGLPEIRLGILPGWGGCTRLPRQVGIAAALDIILAGKTIPSRKAFQIGLVDALLPDAAFLSLVRDFAARRCGRPGPGPGARRGGPGPGPGARRGKARPEASSRRSGGGLKGALLEKNPLGRALLFDQARKQILHETKGHYPAPLRALEVVRIGIEKGRQAGFEAEARALGELATSRISKNLVHVFQLMESVKKPGARPAGTPREIEQAAVLGAGVMGGGIAALIAEQADVPVRLKDIQEAALAGGMKHAAGLFKKLVDRRRMDRTTARRKMALIRPALDDSGLANVDLVVEAVVEKLPVKQAIFAELAEKTGGRAILASNTSSLSIDLIAALSPDPSRIVGMHFFNPVDKMPLVEVIAGPRTGAEAAATIWDFARKLGKTPVLVKDGPGFLVNRLLMFYSTEALWLLGEGHRIEDVDGAMTGWGMPLGPLALTDEVGIDVATKVAHILADAFSDRLPLPPWFERFSGTDRLGAKNGSGFYRYEGRKRTTPDPAVYPLLGLEPRATSPNPTALAERMVLPMVNEAARCLAEGVVGDAGSLDLALIMGTGFPPFRGGLCRWADGYGLGQVLDLLGDLAAHVGPRFTPAEPLRAAAEAGGFYALWPKTA